MKCIRKSIKHAHLTYFETRLIKQEGIDAPVRARHPQPSPDRNYCTINNWTSSGVFHALYSPPEIDAELEGSPFARVAHVSGFSSIGAARIWHPNGTCQVIAGR
jgi:hypothetical protein